MHRFFLPPEQCAPPVLRLTGREAHHAARVLRLQAGAPVVVLDGCGGEHLGEITRVEKSCVIVRVGETRRHPPPPAKITLFQAIPKGRGLEDIIQKATELGVREIVPLFTARTVPQFDASQAQAKCLKWRQIAVEAVKQCGQPWLPQVSPPLPLAQTLPRAGEIELPLLASLAPGAGLVRRWFADFCRERRGPPSSVGLWIGPEGDFSPEETRSLLDAGARPVTLGPLVLRVETAALCALAAIGQELL